MGIPRPAAQLLKPKSSISRTYMATSSPAPAPWRDTFRSHVNTMNPCIFTLGTLHPVEPSSSVSGSHMPKYAPRVRTVVYRGMWAELPVNPKNSADLNPEVYASDLPTFTTDVRMAKVPELFDSASGAAVSSDGDVEAKSTGTESGRGGPVEAMFWFPEVSSQWRFRGHAYVIGPDIESEAAAPVRAALEVHMRGTGQAGAGNWGWSRELTAHFGNLSPGMRGTFKNPPPGTLATEKPGEGLGLGQKVTGLDDEIARSNFRVVVVVPENVERVELSNTERDRRWNYEWVDSETGGSWKISELWP